MDITLKKWEAEGEKRFGPNRMKWQFKCPSCGHVASAEDWKAAGAKEGEVGFSCIGRHIPKAKEAFSKEGKGPCTYAGGGLFRLNPVRILFDDADAMTVFEFADTGEEDGNRTQSDPKSP